MLRNSADKHMLRALLTFLMPSLFLLSCAAPASSSRFHRTYVAPMVTPPTSRSLCVTSRKNAAVAPKKTVESPKQTKEKPPEPVERPQEVSFSIEPSESPPTVSSVVPFDGEPLMMNNSGDAVGTAVPRIEMVVAAKRLLGIKKSFDDRSYLGHLLKVTAMLPSGTNAVSYTPLQHVEWASQRGRLREINLAQPGDIVIFECPGECGQIESNMAAGVIISAQEDTLTWIAHVHQEVQHCTNHPDGQEPFCGDVVTVVSCGLTDPW